jgi:hypothetical protein
VDLLISVDFILQAIAAGQCRHQHDRPLALSTSAAAGSFLRTSTPTEGLLTDWSRSLMFSPRRASIQASMTHLLCQMHACAHFSVFLAGPFVSARGESCDCHQAANTLSSYSVLFVWVCSLQRRSRRAPRQHRLSIRLSRRLPRNSRSRRRRQRRLLPQLTIQHPAMGSSDIPLYVRANAHSRGSGFLPRPCLRSVAGLRQSWRVRLD